MPRAGGGSTDDIEGARRINFIPPCPRGGRTLNGEETARSRGAFGVPQGRVISSGEAVRGSK